MTWSKQPKPRCGESHYGGLLNKHCVELMRTTITATWMVIFETLARALRISKMRAFITRSCVNYNASRIPRIERAKKGQHQLKL